MPNSLRYTIFISFIIVSTLATLVIIDIMEEVGKVENLKLKTLNENPLDYSYDEVVFIPDGVNYQLRARDSYIGLALPYDEYEHENVYSLYFKQEDGEIIRSKRLMITEYKSRINLIRSEDSSIVYSYTPNGYGRYVIDTSKD